MALDIKALARSFYDPARFNSGYRSEKKGLRQALDASIAAEGAAWGSIAQRSNPNNYGSAEGRFNPIFAPPDARALHDPAYDVAEQEVAKKGLRRKQAGASLDDLQGLDGFDDLFGGLF